MRMRALVLAQVAGLLCVAGEAAAQSGVSGDLGFPIGEKSRIHVNFDTGVGFDSNPSREDSTDATSDWKAHFVPGLEVDVPGSSIRLTLKSKLLIQQYFGTGDRDSMTKFGGHVGARLRLGSKSSVLGLELVDTLSRTPTVFEDVGSAGADEIRYVQWHNAGLVNLVLRPGGGALELRLGYGNELNLYDVETELPQGQEHRAVFEAKLRFLPRTAALFMADLGFFSANGAGASSTRRSSPYNLSVGLQGQITERITTNLRIGFGDSLTWNGDFFSDLANTNVRTLIAGVNVAYAFGEGSSLSLGYQRSVKPVVLLDAYTADSPYGTLKLGIMGGRLLFGLYGQFEHRNFAISGTSNLVTFDSRVEYWFFEYLRGGIGYQMLHQFGIDATAQGLEKYTRHTAMVFAGLTY